MCETLDLPRSPAERQETEKLKTTNYFDTFIRVAEDCPATSGMVPPLFFDKPTVAGVQHEMIAGCPYTYTSGRHHLFHLPDRAGPGSRGAPGRAELRLGKVLLERAALHAGIHAAKARTHGLGASPMPNLTLCARQANRRHFLKTAPGRRAILVVDLATVKE
jgi:hypothetical protein